MEKMLHSEDVKLASNVDPKVGVQTLNTTIKELVLNVRIQVSGYPSSYTTTRISQKVLSTVQECVSTERLIIKDLTQVYQEMPNKGSQASSPQFPPRCKNGVLKVGGKTLKLVSP